MSNRDIEAAWRYHNSTKHSASSIRHNAHFLDWRNQPMPFKIYSALDPIPLPRETTPTGMAALSAIAGEMPPSQDERVPTLEALTSLLYFAAGVTKKRTFPGGEFFFRAAACTGALYEIELYLVCGALPGLEAGVYHFGPADFALRRLRAGDFRGVLAHATAEEPAIVHAPVTIICSGTYWRNSWKYQARTYRHFGWDNGTILANLLAMSVAHQLPAKLVCAFSDDDVNRLLGLPVDREVAFSMVALGYTDAFHPEPPEVGPLELETVPLSRNEVDYPAMREMHAASSLVSPDEVRCWRVQDGERLPRRRVAETPATIPLRPLPEDAMPRDSIEQVILRRGSTREFAREPIGFERLSTILERSTRGVPADFLPRGAQLDQLYLIVNAVTGLAPGAYFFNREQRALELLKEGEFRNEAFYLGLEQDLPGDSSVAVFFLADLPAILDRFGNRGYRAVQLEAGIIGGKMYVAAYAQRLGATGLTFYDDEVVNFFSPHAEGKSAIFLVALGKAAKPARR